MKCDFCGNPRAKYEAPNEKGVKMVRCPDSGCGAIYPEDIKICTVLFAVA